MRSFKVIDHPESEKIIIEKNVEKEVKHGILYAMRTPNNIFYHNEKIYLTSSIRFFFVRLEAASHSISQNIETIDHPVPEINNYND